MNASTSGRGVGGKRMKETDKILGEFFLGVDRVGGEGRGIGEGGHGGAMGEPSGTDMSRSARILRVESTVAGHEY